MPRGLANLNPEMVIYQTEQTQITTVPLVSWRKVLNYQFRIVEPTILRGMGISKFWVVSPFGGHGYDTTQFYFLSFTPTGLRPEVWCTLTACRDHLTPRWVLVPGAPPRRLDLFQRVNKWKIDGKICTNTYPITPPPSGTESTADFVTLIPPQKNPIRLLQYTNPLYSISDNFTSSLHQYLPMLKKLWTAPAAVPAVAGSTMNDELK